MTSRSKYEICEHIAKARKLGSIVIMPDFFIDRFVTVPSLNTLTESIMKKIQVGGGSLHGFSQYELKGGNAVNTAYSLGKLGVCDVRLVTVAEGVSLSVLRQTFSTVPNVKVRVVKGRPGQTISLEFRTKERMTNVMLSDIGDVSCFDAERLINEDWRSISKASFLSLMNWAANAKGTDLTQSVFSYGRSQKVKTVFAPADFSGRVHDFKRFLELARDKELVSIFSLNENEIRMVERILRLEPMTRNYHSSDIVKSARKVSDAMSTRVDIHTPIGAGTALCGSTFYSPSFKVIQRFITGAGDVWDAANIAGELMGLDPDQRLLFANACGGLYVSNTVPEPPTLFEANEFFKHPVETH